MEITLGDGEKLDVFDKTNEQINGLLEALLNHVY